MSGHDVDNDFKRWTEEWQAGAARDITTEEQIRHYVKRRSGLLWAFFLADFVIGGVMLPFLVYFSVTARNHVERWAMWGLAYVTIAAVCFGWWNWRGVLRSSAATTAEYLAISTERLRRLRMAWRIGWVVLAAEVAIFIIWIWDHLYSGARAHDSGAERFAWGWLGGFTLVAIVSLIWFGRWITRDAARFEALRRELE